MRKYIVILFLCFTTFFLVCCDRSDKIFMPDKNNHEDVEYSRLVDSVDKLLWGFNYFDFNDSILYPALEYYNNDDNMRHLWMRARCNFLIGMLKFNDNVNSDKPVANLLEALDILDEHFNTSYPQVCCLYSKIHYTNSRIAFNHSDGNACSYFANLGLYYAALANDTSCIAYSYYNLAIIYDRIDVRDTLNTPYTYYQKGISLIDSCNYKMELACLENAYANYLRYKREYDSAIVHYNKLKTLISDNTQLYHKTLAEEAFVYYRKNDYQSAINNLLEAYESDADYIKIMAVNGLADCYKMIGDTVRSTEYLMYIAEYMNQLTVTKKYNMNAISLLNAYIESKSVHSKDAGMAWILVVVTVVIAVIITIYYILRKKHNMIIKDKNLETLMIKVDAIYRDKYGNKKQRILDEFNAVFPETIAVLKETYSDLNETEVNVCVLSFFPFQLKEVADILNLRVNTVSKSKISLKKKTNKENINDILRPFIS